MLTPDNQTKLTNKLMIDIKDLLNAFFIQTGVTIVPTIEVVAEVDRDVIGLRELVSVVNTTVDLDIYPSGLSTKSRKRDIVMKRQVVCYLARQMGYPLNIVGRSMIIDHATVIHGCNIVRDLLENKDIEMLAVYSDILSIVNAYYKEKYGKDLSKIKRGGDNS